MMNGRRAASAINFLGKLTAAGLFFLSLFLSHAFAADFQIQPTSLDLGAGISSGAFSVINNGDDKFNVQVSVKQWTQDASGKDLYEETNDIVFFPKIMTVQRNEQRAIRVGWKGQPAPLEKTYRLFVEELPSLKKSDDEKSSGKITAGISIAFRYATPIFVKPVRQQENVVIEKVEMTGGIVRATIRNSGNIHIKLGTVRFSGANDAGKEIFSREVGGWYILNGVSRSYEMSIPKELCKDLVTIGIKAESENFNRDGLLKVDKEMCGL